MLRLSRAPLAAMIAVIVTLVFVQMMLMSSLAQSTDLTADELLDNMLDSMRGGTLRATMSMTVTRPDEENTYVIDVIGDGEERSLIRVIEPARDAGQAFLTEDNNLFLYNPRLRRTLRVPPSGRSDSFLGSDLNYNDIAGRAMEEDYDAEITEQDAETFELTLTPKANAPTHYGKVVTYGRKSDFAPLEYLYFDQRDTAVRRINLMDYTETPEGLPFPQTLEITNLLEEGESTTLRYTNVDFDSDIAESCFTERALERGCD
jgi:outer membrane lipoprotein-sorting protein